MTALTHFPLRTFSAVSVHRFLVDVRRRIVERNLVCSNIAVGDGRLRYEVSEPGTLLRQGSGPAGKCKSWMSHLGKC